MLLLKCYKIHLRLSFDISFLFQGAKIVFIAVMSIIFSEMVVGLRCVWERSGKNKCGAFRTLFIFAEAFAVRFFFSGLVVKLQSSQTRYFGALQLLLTFERFMKF